MSIEITVIAETPIELGRGGRLIFFLECSDSDYITRNPAFLSYPIKDAIIDALRTDETGFDSFTFKVRVFENRQDLSSRSIVTRETIEQAVQIHRIVEAALSNRFESLRRELHEHAEDSNH